WVALDWPLGALGGYLASAHTGQFILIALAAPPLLLLGLRPSFASIATEGRAGRWLRLLTHPLPAFVGFNGVVLGTHVPDLVDGLMASQLGSLALDLAWLVGGLFLWWPVAAPERFRRLSPPLQMAYLFVQTIPATLPSAFLVFSTYPLYQLYELAPRVTPALTPRYDHQIAGLMMKVVADPVVWIGIGVVFFRWARAERQADLDNAPRAGGGVRLSADGTNHAE
ncbi:MAG: cytochrome c oxidase assembly protein, partial [Gemmatimonadales bacterium]